MFGFLSKFSLSSRLYTSFLLLGLYLTLVCFVCVFAIKMVQSEYTKADNLIQSAQDYSSIESYLMALDRTLYSFQNTKQKTEKNNVMTSFESFQNKTKEVGETLETIALKESYDETLKTANKAYNIKIKEMLSLFDKSSQTIKTVKDLSKKSSQQLGALIDDTTLPSATFALNSLQESLDVVLLSIEKISTTNEESQKQLKNDFMALKKAKKNSEKAEMVNAKKLKEVFSSLSTLEEECNRYLKISKALSENIASFIALNQSNSQEFQKILTEMNLASDAILSKADSSQIVFQKIFVFSAAFGGLLTVIMGVVCMFGIKYPLNRLIETAQKMARGDISVSVYFTERTDEVGELAKALAVLLMRLKSLPELTHESLEEKSAFTYGATSAYVPLGAAVDVSVEDFQEKIENEKNKENLLKMQENTKKISEKINVITANLTDYFQSCQNQLATVDKSAENITGEFKHLEQVAKEEKLASLLDNVRSLADMLTSCMSYAQELLLHQEVQKKSSDYILGLFGQIQAFAQELLNRGVQISKGSNSICSNLAETKILALNASIEAVKGGEKSRQFASLCSKIRMKTQNAKDESDDLTAQVSSVNQDLMQFSNVIQILKDSVEKMYNALNEKDALQNDQVHEITSFLNKFQTFEADLEQEILFTIEKQEIHKNILSNLNEIKLVPYNILKKLETAENSVKELNDTLSDTESETKGLTAI